LTSKHTDDDRWLAALAGQAEPDDAQTNQAASLRRYLELQDEREATLERKAAGRMARRLQAGLAAAQAEHADEATSTGLASQPRPAAQAAPRGVSASAPTSPSSGSGSGSASASSWWSRGWAWCFPPLQGNGGHYAAAGALTVAVVTGVMLAPGWLSGAQDAAPASTHAADERVALAEPARRTEAPVAVQDLASATVPANRKPAAVASVVAPTSPGAADVGSKLTAKPDATSASKTAARVTAKAAAPQADSVTARLDTGSVRGLVAPQVAAAAPAAVATSGDTTPMAVTAAAAATAAANASATSAARTAAQRQRLSVPQPGEAAAQLEDLLRQQDIPYAMRITPGVWLLDADVPEAKRPGLIEPLRKFRLELPADGKLRVRLTPTR
jgi:hypothetical protein